MGSAIEPVANWPTFIPVMLLMATFVGGCAGSTGGGLKVIRVLLLFLQGVRELKRLVHPNAVYTIKLGHRALPERVIEAVWGFSPPMPGVYHQPAAADGDRSGCFFSLYGRGFCVKQRGDWHWQLRWPLCRCKRCSEVDFIGNNDVRPS